MRLRVTMPVLILGVLLASSASAFTSNIDVEDFYFFPRNDTILIHDSVRWTNNGAALHTTTGTGAELWNSGNMGFGGTFTRQFNNVGIFPFRCSNHPSLMTGSIVVIGATNSKATSWGKLKQVYRKARIQNLQKAKH